MFKIKNKKKWQLLLIGYSTNLLGQKIRNLIKFYKLDKNIKILDGQSNIESFYKKIDFSVSTSEEEGSSNFLLESISNALPIIAFDVGGNKDFFNGNGNLVKKNDFQEFQYCLEKMIDSKSSLVLKKNSFNHSLKKFNNEESLKKYLNSYNKK